MYQYIAEVLGLLETKNYTPLSAFQIISTVKKLKILDCHYIPHIKQVDCYLFLMNYEVDRTQTHNPYAIMGRPELSSDRDYFYYLWMPLVQDWGRVLMQPERFMDKVIQFFKKNYDLNFKNNKRFSSNFLVQTDDTFRAEYLVTTDFMTVMQDKQELVLEFVGKEMVMRSLKHASMETATYLIQTAQELAAIISVHPE